MNWLVASSLGAIAAAGALALWMRRRLVLVTVQGSSMEPTLFPGDRVLVHRRGLAGVRRGQVVVLEPPPPGDGHRVDAAATSLNQRLWNIKRVAAVPGDPVPPGVAVMGRVPPDALVVLGDSASSTDSRQRGFYFAADLLGVVVRRLSTRAAAPAEVRVTKPK